MKSIRTLIVCASLAGMALPGQTQTRMSRTRDGHPDLQGIWTNATITPLERPAGLAKGTLTDEEAKLFEKKAAEDLANSMARRMGRCWPPRDRLGRVGTTCSSSTADRNSRASTA